MVSEGMRRLLIAGNWKLNKTATEAREYIQNLRGLLPAEPAVDVALMPAYIALEAAVEAAAGSPIVIGSQNVYWETSGAFTGEISAGMIRSLGALMAIVGHSERRQYFGETDETVNKRVRAALDGGLAPVVCVGETLEEREGERTFQVIETQIRGGLDGLSEEDGAKLCIAYEPVWAIGTGRTATPEMAQEVHAYIRALLAGLFNKDLANTIRILYGGSVKPGNAAELMGQPDIDGALVGGASLKPDDFIGIINNS